MKGVIDLKFTPEARAAVVSFIGDVDAPGATICLMKGRTTGETVDEWMYNYYDDGNIPKVEEMLREHNQPLLYECDGLTVAIPQFHLVPELTGKMLGLAKRNRLVVKERHDG